jgi:hypothetical protein
VAAPWLTRATVSGPALTQRVLLSRMPLAVIWPRTGPASVQSDRFITNDYRSMRPTRRPLFQGARWWVGIEFSVVIVISDAYLSYLGVRSASTGCSSLRRKGAMRRNQAVVCHGVERVKPTLSGHSARRNATPWLSRMELAPLPDFVQDYGRLSGPVSQPWSQLLRQVQIGTASTTLGPACVEMTRVSSKPASLNSVFILFCRTVASAHHHEHVQVQPLAEEWLLARRQHKLDHQKFAVRGYRTAALAKDGDAPFIVPVMQDLSEHVCFASRWHLDKEITANNFASISDSG